jgi:hypothetical protein
MGSVNISNNRTRGSSNRTKTSTSLPSIDDVPKYILLKDCVNEDAIFQMSRKFRPLHGNFSTSSKVLIQ